MQFHCDHCHAQGTIDDHDIARFPTCPQCHAPLPAQAPDGFATLRPAEPQGRSKGSSPWPLILLIFLIPYAIVITGALIYLLTRPQPVDPLEFLPDPSKKGMGQPRRVQHDLPLARRLVVALGQPSQVGILEVLPLGVTKNSDGDLALTLQLKNLSNNLAFTPLSDDFLRFTSGADSLMPYSFLEVPAQPQQRLYGGYLEWLNGDEVVGHGELLPGAQGRMRITTLDSYRAKVPSLLGSHEPLIWRLQVRRGMIKMLDGGTAVSATTVIGVEFRTGDVKGVTAPQVAAES